MPQPPLESVPRAVVSRLALSSLLVLTLCLPPAVSASTVVPLDLAQLTERAERVFLGTCLTARPGRVDGEIVTHLEFAVTEALKGDAGVDTLRVSLPGGLWQGVRQSISGMPVIAAGDELVLFLSGADAMGRVWPIGLGQGGFRVERGGSGPARVHQDLEGLRVLPAAAARPAGAPEAMPGNLADLLSRVRSLSGAPTVDGSAP